MKTRQEVTNAEVIDAWTKGAAASLANFDEEGDFARQHILNPALFALLGDVQGRTILDAGCGNGYFSRLLARKGATVTGVEPALYQVAVEHEQSAPLGIDYLQEDLSAVLARQPHLRERFDVVVANMVLQDIPDCEAAMANCLGCLKPNGDFVFSILHPCFEESATAWAEKGFVAVAEYFEHKAIPQQKFGHFFHRPFSYYLNTAVEQGGRIQRVVEPQVVGDFAALGRMYERDKFVPSFLIIHARRDG